MLNLSVHLAGLLIIYSSVAENLFPRGRTKSGKPCIQYGLEGNGIVTNVTEYTRLKNIARPVVTEREINGTISNITEYFLNWREFVARQNRRGNGPLPPGELYDCFLDLDTEEYKLTDHLMQAVNGDEEFYYMETFEPRELPNSYIKYFEIYFHHACSKESSGVHFCHATKSSNIKYKRIHGKRPLIGMTKLGETCFIVDKFDNGINGTEYRVNKDDFVLREQKRGLGPLPKGEIYACYLVIDTQEYQFSFYSRNESVTGSFVETTVFNLRNTSSADYSATLKYLTECEKEVGGTYRCSTKNEHLL